MPIPKPRKGEKQKDYIPRCMGSIAGEYDDNSQAVAICYSTFRQAKKSFEAKADVIKVDESLGLVLGYAIVCTENGEPYFDVQGDHIPEDSMLKASLDFMENSQVAKEMHDGDQTGTVVFAWPMTEDIAKAFGIETKKTGLMIAVKPNKNMLEKFKSGELTGFSIGGEYIQNEEVED